MNKLETTHPSVAEIEAAFLSEQHTVPLIGASLIPLILRAQGIDVVPCLQGGQIMPTLDRVSRALTQIYFKTEQGLAFALAAMGKAGRRPYVGIVTSGPGGLNTVAALADATRDCSPMGLIAGQVPTGAFGTDAFQGIEITDVTRPVTKSSRLIESVKNLVHCIPRDLGLAASGKPGSVLWDLPKDIQFAEVDIADFRDDLKSYEEFVETPSLDEESLDEAIRLLYESESPVILAGYGLVLADAFDEFHEFLKLTGLPVVHTLPGKSAVRSDYGLNLGMLGMNGLYAASAASYHADFVLSLGARYDDRAVGRPGEFAPAAQKRRSLIHVDVEEKQFYKARELSPNKRNVIGHAKEVIEYLLAHIDPARIKIDRWRRTIAQWQHEQKPPPSQYAGSDELDIIYLLESVNEMGVACRPDSSVVTDVGNHQMWAAQRLHTTAPNSFFTSAGLGTMGSGIPQSLGVQLVEPTKSVITIQGDQGYQCCNSELRTAARYNLPIKVLIINNGGQAIVRQWTTHMFGGNNVGVIDHVDGVQDMDFVKNSESYGVPAERVSQKNEIAAALRRAMEHDGPYVLDCVVPHEECYPWIKPGFGFPGIQTGGT